MILSGINDTARHARGVLALCDPAAKIAAAVLFTVGVCLLQTPRAAALAAVFPLVLLPFSGVPLHAAIKRLAAVNLFFLFLWLTVPLALSPRPDTLASFGPLHFHKAGILLAAAITLKGNAAALALIALIDSSSAAVNARALLRLRVPRKFVTLLLLTYANLHLMHREATRLFQAAKLRGFAPRCSFASFRTYAWLTGMVLIRSWQRAHSVNDAMKLRAFTGVFPVLHFGETAPRPAAATVLVTVSLIVPAAMHLYERMGGTV